MKTPDEIKKGLECCTPVWAGNHWKSCNSNCPYIGLVDSCRGQLMYDALAYIQQLEAKLAKYKRPIFPLTFAEAMEDDYYLEIKGDEYVDVALNCFATDANGDGWISFTTHDNDGFKFRQVDYGKTWRCWSRRPTYEERKAAKWDE